MQCLHKYKNNRVSGNMFPLTTLNQKNIKKSACYTTDRVKFTLSFFMLSGTR